MKEFNSSGELIIQDATITDPGSPVNKSYVDNLVPLGAYAGTASPEGKITAPVGSIYTDSAATNGAIRWIKTTPTGATGWEVEYGDTGWRDIKGLNAADFSGALAVRRINSIIHIRLINLSPPEDMVRPTIAILPGGFKAGGRAMLPLTHSTAIGTQARLWVDSAIARVVMGNDNTISGVYGPSAPLTGTNSFVTNDPWPTSLPGTPA